MSGNTKIEWATRVWNPVTGCSPVSAGCENCYAKRMANRLRGRAGYPRENPFDVTLHNGRLDQPFHWRTSERVFLCSMGDLFHEDVPHGNIVSVLSHIEAAPQHTFMVLTKRPAIMLDHFSRGLSQKFPILPNLWLGITAENQKTADERIPLLLQTPAAKRFVSVEPMLGPVDFGFPTYELFHPAHETYFEICGDMENGRLVDERAGIRRGWHRGLHWVICGGESGPGARPMHPGWPRSLWDQCQAAGVPFFFKQWGKWKPWEPGDCGAVIHISEQDGATGGQPGYVDVPSKPFGVELRCDTRPMARVGKKAAGCLLDGREWKEFPEERL